MVIVDGLRVGGPQKCGRQCDVFEAPLFGKFTGGRRLDDDDLPTHHHQSRRDHILSDIEPVKSKQATPKIKATLRAAQADVFSR